MRFQIGFPRGSRAAAGFYPLEQRVQADCVHPGLVLDPATHGLGFDGEQTNRLCLDQVRLVSVTKEFCV